MPEARDLPLHRWGEALRRDRLRRRARQKLAATMGAAAAVVALAATLIWPPGPVLVWNRSASSPLGLYFVTSGDKASPGDMALAWPPPAARRFAAVRGYLPFNVPLVKHVAAARGDRVCAVGEAVFVNGRFQALRRREDLVGRLLPWWTGCRNLRAGELFLLMPGAPDSFDGRYFGVTAHPEMLGRARLIWAA